MLTTRTEAMKASSERRQLFSSTPEPAASEFMDNCIGYLLKKPSAVKGSGSPSIKNEQISSTKSPELHACRKTSISHNVGFLDERAPLLPASAGDAGAGRSATTLFGGQVNAIG